MTALAPFGPDDRLLVLAPHPDDETLATGLLIRSALRAGAALRIVFATDGDNNPWPQRWIERRWRIGKHEQARWGERRRQEAAAALRALGVDARAACFLGWPDQGLTDCLMRGDEPVAILADEIRAFAPTQVALPALADRHPDHGALRVLAELALHRAACAATRLAYVVHGDGAPADTCVVSGDEADLRCKQQALLAHTSQLALSRKRLLGLVERPECFVVMSAAESQPMASDAEISIRIPYRPGLRRRDLLLVLVTRDETSRFRFALPRWTAQGSRVVLDAAQGSRAALGSRVAPDAGQGAHVTPNAGAGRVFLAQRIADAWMLTLPPPAAPLLAVYAKLDRRWPRLVVFDNDYWRDDPGCPCTRCSPLPFTGEVARGVHATRG